MSYPNEQHRLVCKASRLLAQSVVNWNVHSQQVLHTYIFHNYQTLVQLLFQSIGILE